MISEFWQIIGLINGFEVIIICLGNLFFALKRRFLAKKYDPDGEKKIGELLIILKNRKEEN